MTLKIFNSLSQKREEFKPLEPGTAKIYVCGPTVYDDPHIGHLRSAYVFEVVRNYLKYTGHKVRFARNVTDVDDKIIEKARQGGAKDLNAATVDVAEKYFALYKRDLKKLGIQDPDFEPKATGHIPQMVEMIRALIDKGHAYEAGGDVYFNVGSFSEYGEVSHQKPDQMLEESRVEAGPNKKNALDFALWKKAKEGEPSWDSPWGKGRPGWHIECTAMSLSYFGGCFDIHGGGRDLLFPHHENENAQSRCVTGKSFVNLWMHHGLITVGGRKMSKSFKNFITLAEAMKEDPQYGDEVLKLTFLGTHYSAPLDYTGERLQMDRAVWRRFFDFFGNARLLEKESHAPSDKKTAEITGKFREAMDNDFNTPDVLTLMHGYINQTYKQNDAIFTVSVAAAVRNFGAEIFGIVFDQDAASVDLKPEIESEIIRRTEARKQKDYRSADEIRNRLLRDKKVELRDLPDGRTTWRVKL